MKNWLKSPQFIWWVVVVAALIRGGYALREPLDERDAAVYRAVGHNLAAGRGHSEDGVTPETTFAPVPSLLLAAVYALGGGERMGRELWAALGVGTVMAAWLLARERHGLVAANLAALGVALYPYNVLMGAAQARKRRT